MEPTSRHPTRDTHLRLGVSVVRHLQRADAQGWHFVTGGLLSGPVCWPEGRDDVTSQEYEARGLWRRLRDGVARPGEPYL